MTTNKPEVAMTDRELLMLAAKAAGLIIVDEDDDLTLYVISQHRKRNGDEYGERWAPLEDDGDALRLAVRLGMCVDVRQAHTEATPPGDRYTESEEHEYDPEAATRRAIVRAAAETGREMT